MIDAKTKQSLEPYQLDGGKGYHNAIYGGLGEYGYSLVSKRRASKLQPYISASDKVFEYGVGSGWNLAELKASSLKGFDVATTVRTIVEAHGIRFTDQITAEDLAAYDMIICSHVLEHLEKPTDALTQISDCLKPNGRVLFYLPFDYRPNFRKYDVTEPNHHLYSWCVQSFGNLATLYGFTIVEAKLRRFGYERIIAKWVERFHLPRWAYSFLLRIALMVRPEYEMAFLAVKSQPG
jgi:SAM-dependent methyltransferase